MKTIDELSDKQLIWRIKAKDCEECLFTLIDRHSRLFYKISQRYFPAQGFNSPPLAEDFIGSKDSVIYECVLAFRANRGVKFSTWLGNFVRYKCLNYLNKNSRYIHLDDDGLAFAMKQKSLDNHDLTKSSEDYDYIHNLLRQMKDDRITKIFELRYLSGEKKMTWEKIGKKMEMSAQTAINLHNKGKGILKKKVACKSYEDKII